jgi:hypothetical protein
MMKKIIAIVFVAGICFLTFWFYNNQKKSAIPAEFPKTPAAILDKLASDVDLDFSPIQPLEIIWNLNNETVDSVKISAQGFDVTEISPANENKIYSFFTDNGFGLDNFNIADGTVSGLKGYKKDQIICTVVNGFSSYKEEAGGLIPGDENKKNVEVRCGRLSDLIKI